MKKVPLSKQLKDALEMNARVINTCGELRLQRDSAETRASVYQTIIKDQSKQIALEKAEHINFFLLGMLAGSTLLLILSRFI